MASHTDIYKLSYVYVYTYRVRARTPIVVRCVRMRARRLSACSFKLAALPRVLEHASSHHSTFYYYTMPSHRVSRRRVLLRWKGRKGRKGAKARASAVAVKAAQNEKTQLVKKACKRLSH